MPDCDNMLTIEEAANVLGVCVTRARALVDQPDHIAHAGNAPARYFYCRKRVEAIAQQRKCEKCLKDSNKGKRPCYLCRTKCFPADMTSGMCASCHAAKIVRNFACKGDCLFHSPEERRVQILCQAVQQLRDQLSAGKVKAM